MLIDTPQIVEGSSIINATISSGGSFPVAANVGELFYIVDGGLLSPPLGLYVFNGTDWEVVSVGAEEQDPDLTNHIANQSVHLNSTQKDFLDGVSVAFGDVNKLTGLELFLGNTTLPLHLGTVGDSLTALAVAINSLNTTKFNIDGSSTMTGNINLGGFTLVNAAPPVNPNDVVTKAYVDSSGGQRGSLIGYSYPQYGISSSTWSDATANLTIYNMLFGVTSDAPDGWSTAPVYTSGVDALPTGTPYEGLWKTGSPTYSFSNDNRTLTMEVYGPSHRVDVGSASYRTSGVVYFEFNYTDVFDVIGVATQQMALVGSTLPFQTGFTGTISGILRNSGSGAQFLWIRNWTAAGGLSEIYINSPTAAAEGDVIGYEVDVGAGKVLGIYINGARVVPDGLLGTALTNWNTYNQWTAGAPVRPHAQNRTFAAGQSITLTTRALDFQQTIPAGAQAFDPPAVNITTSHLVLGDTVTQRSADGSFSDTQFWDGTAWISLGATSSQDQWVRAVVATTLL